MNIIIQRHFLNTTLGAIAFGVWQHSISGGLAFYFLLTILADFRE
jgi:hypothetical protein